MESGTIITNQTLCVSFLWFTIIGIKDRTLINAATSHCLANTATMVIINSTKYKIFWIILFVSISGNKDPSKHEIK